MINPHEASAKERILLVAKERFLREGFAKVSIEDLASDLGMSKKTFYKCFHSKEDLLSEIVDRLLAEIESSLLAILRSETPFVGKLDGLMNLIGKKISRVFRPFMHEIQRYAPHLWYRTQEFRRERMTLHFMALMNEGISTGYVRPDVNPRILFLTFLGAIESILVPSVLVDESFSADEAIHGILQILFRGILTEDAGKQLFILHDTKLHQQT